MKTSTYICNQCNDSFNNGWVTIKSQNKLYTYCCYSCYKINPIIVPSEAVFKSKMEHNETINNDTIIIHTNKTYLNTVNDSDDNENIDYGYYSDNELEMDEYSDSSEESLDDY